jgi:isopenicillin N synthase-like dioxygenase
MVASGLGLIYAGFHTDLNFLTIHGQSRYPGRKVWCERADAVNIWARNTGKRIPARVPEGCLLVQAGKQLEWLSGGLVKGAQLDPWAS